MADTALPTPTAQSSPIDRECRVCRQSTGQLYQPCKCKGSIRFVHQECLTQWLRIKGISKCELCGHEFSFKKIYNPNAAPVRLPDLCLWLLSKSVQLLPKLARFLLVALSWLGLIPLLTSWLVFAFVAPLHQWPLPLSAPLELPLTIGRKLIGYTPAALLYDLQVGILTCVLIVALSVLVASLRELLREELDPELWEREQLAEERRQQQRAVNQVQAALRAEQQGQAGQPLALMPPAQNDGAAPLAGHAPTAPATAVNASAQSGETVESKQRRFSEPVMGSSLAPSPASEHKSVSGLEQKHAPPVQPGNAATPAAAAAAPNAGIGRRRASDDDADAAGDEFEHEHDHEHDDDFADAEDEQDADGEGEGDWEGDEGDEEADEAAAAAPVPAPVQPITTPPRAEPVAQLPDATLATPVESKRMAFSDSKTEIKTAETVPQSSSLQPAQQQPDQKLPQSAAEDKEVKQQLPESKLGEQPLASVQPDNTPPAAQPQQPQAQAPAAAAPGAGNNNNNADAAAQNGRRRRRRRRRRGGAADENFDDVPLTHWLGFEGNLRYFGIHLLSVALFNFIFLGGALLVPLNLGRLFFALTGLSAKEFSFSLMLFAGRTLMPLFTATAAAANSTATATAAAATTVATALLANETAEVAVEVAVEAVAETAAPAALFIGRYTAEAFHSAFYVQDLTILLVGYCSLLLGAGMWAMTISGLAQDVGNAMRAGLRYLFVGVKVCLLLACELVVFPFIVGWAVDLLTLDLLGGDLASRHEVFVRHPFWTTLLHWALGDAGRPECRHQLQFTSSPA